MRLMMDTLVALMLMALLGGVMWYKRADQTDTHQRESTRAEVRRFQQQISLQAALATVQHNERGFPATVDPQWFMGDLPDNTLLTNEHPWLEVAGPEEKDLVHPRLCVATSSTIAKFWYNPSNGILRARVPVTISDKAAIDLYTFVNECGVPDLFK